MYGLVNRAMEEEIVRRRSERAPAVVGMIRRPIMGSATEFEMAVCVTDGTDKRGGAGRDERPIAQAAR